MNSRGLFALVIAPALLAWSSSGYGGTVAEEKSPVKVADDGGKTVYDRIWDLATLYRNDANPIIEEFKLRGRYQGQYHCLDSDQGDSDGWENRRSRFGFDAKLFHKVIEVRLDAEQRRVRSVL